MSKPPRRDPERPGWGAGSGSLRRGKPPRQQPRGIPVSLLMERRQTSARTPKPRAGLETRS